MQASGPRPNRPLGAISQNTTVEPRMNTDQHRYKQMMQKLSFTLRYRRLTLWISVYLCSSVVYEHSSPLQLCD